MKKLPILLLTLIVISLGIAVCLCILNTEEIPVILFPNDYDIKEPQQPNDPLKDPNANEPIVEPDPPVVEPDPPVVEPDPPVIEPDPPAVPTDPVTVEYWLYHVSDRAICADRDALNAVIRASGSVHRIEEVNRAFTAADIAALIEAYTLPKAGYLADGTLHESAFYDAVLQNRAMGEVKDVTALTALTTAKADLRAFPTKESCYSSNLMQDLFQEASLPVGTPVLLLHQSEDGELWFVYSYFYSGWIAADQLMTVDEAEFQRFADPDRFAVVTVPESESGLVMGTILPLVSQTEGALILALPGGKTVTVAQSEASVGFMEATVHNLLKLSFSLKGLPYSWGDKGMGVDCSGMYVAAFRCMGIFLPRNTGPMRSVSGADYISLKDGIPADLEGAQLIFHPGHVMLYLGTVENDHYILHAPGSGNYVRVDVLSRTDNLISAFAPK